MIHTLALLLFWNVSLGCLQVLFSCVIQVNNCSTLWRLDIMAILKKNSCCAFNIKSQVGWMAEENYRMSTMCGSKWYGRFPIYHTVFSELACLHVCISNELKRVFVFPSFSSRNNKCWSFSNILQNESTEEHRYRRTIIV